MCDVLIAMQNSTKRGTIIFAKNSDRDINECQQIRYVPHMLHKEKWVQCTFEKLPQVSETYEAILFCPYWCWGAEMGINECGLCIGNVAVKSKEPLAEKGKGLTGMDMIRLALERCSSAYEALHLIVQLIQKFPQALYHNSFIITDKKEAWILETAGKYWVARKVRDVYAISNTYTIENEWDEAHDDLIKHAIERGWCRSESEFNFAKVYGDFKNVMYMRDAQIRWKRALSLLKANKGNIDVKYMMRIMRDHSYGTLIEPRWASNEVFFTTLCVHATGETAASMIVELFNHDVIMTSNICWALLSSPCTSVYFPLFLGGIGIPKELSIGSDKYDEKSIWWLFERIQRLVDLNYKPLAPLVRAIWDYIEEIELNEVDVLRFKISNLAESLSEARNMIEEYVKHNFERILRIAKEVEQLVIQLNKVLPSYPNLRKEYIIEQSKKANMPLL